MGDIYGDAFPRKRAEALNITTVNKKDISLLSGRGRDTMFDTHCRLSSIKCRLDVIRASQTIQNKLLNDVVRTDDLLASISSKFLYDKNIEAALSKN